jgi:hypothetical protein
MDFGDCWQGSSWPFALVLTFTQRNSVRRYSGTVVLKVIGQQLQHESARSLPAPGNGLRQVAAQWAVGE